MQLAILTQPLRYNIGGILQNYALQQVLLKMGHTPVTIDPDPFLHVSPIIILKRIIKKIFGKNIEVFIERRLNQTKWTRGENTFRFVQKYINVKTYRTINEVSPDKYDCFIVGSDQVWRPEYNVGRLGNMFLDFTVGWNVKRIAYAASFGKDDCIFTDEQRDKYCSLLQKFDFVSVREITAVNLCKKLFNTIAIHVLDPTFLLEKSDYIDIIKKEKEPTSPGNMLVYFLDYSHDKERLVDKIASDYSLLPFHSNSISEKDKVIPQKSVSQWLRGFYDAKLVVTDSFHACVFSIIFNKPFILYANKDRGMERYLSLFESLGIKNSWLYNSNDYYGIPFYDYELINNRLSLFKKRSFDFLRKALSE